MHFQLLFVVLRALARLDEPGAVYIGISNTTVAKDYGGRYDGAWDMTYNDTWLWDQSIKI